MQTTTWSGLTMYYTVPFSIRKITWAALIVNCAGWTLEILTSTWLVINVTLFSFALFKREFTLLS